MLETEFINVTLQSVVLLKTPFLPPQLNDKNIGFNVEKFKFKEFSPWKYLLIVQL